MSTRVALYLRVSTEEQTLDNQRPEVEQLARQRGAIVAEYEETASAAKHRPAHERLMNDARRGAFDVLAIWALDRFGRSMVGNLQDVLELDRVGVRVTSVRESWLDTSGPTRSLLVAVFSWVAEQERTRLVERTRAGMQRAAKYGTKSGKCIGRPQRIDRPTVTHALAMRAAGRSVRQIAVALKIPRSTLAGAMAEALASENPHRERTPRSNGDSST